MIEFLRKFWFICLIAIVLIGFLCYYIVDMNKDNVSSKKVDGKDVVASVTAGDVTSDTIFDRYQSFNQSLLYNMYRNAVVEQSVEATKDMESQAKTMAKTIKTNMDSDSTGKTRYQVIAELASYGYEGEDKLQDYCLMSLKQKQLDKEYISENFDELVKKVTSSPRSISIITMEVANPETLSEDAKTKQENIQKALDGGDDFASVATAFSEDVNTAGNEGVYGYVDSTSTGLDSAVISEAVKLDKGQTSEWITVSNQQTGKYTLYLVHVDETDPKALLDSTNAAISEGMVNAVLSANPGLEVTIIENAAKDLDVAFEDDSVKAQVENYIKTQTQSGGESDEE